MTENKTAQYESPLCTQLEIAHEGILCASGINFGSGHDGIGGNDDDIFNS